MGAFSFSGNTWGDKSIDQSMDATKSKINAPGAYSVGLDQSKGIIADEQSRLAAREKAGMPTAAAATAKGATIGTAGASGQASLADRMKALWSGGPTPGSTAAYAANDQAKAGMYASAFGNVGGAGAARAMRTTANQGALMDAQTARQADLIRAQEQQAALQQYAQLGTAMRSGDMADAAEWNKINAANAGFAQQSALANQQSALKWQAMNDAQKRGLLSMGVDLDQNEFGNRLAGYGAEYDYAAQQREQKRMRDQAEREKMGQGLSLAMLGLTAGMSGGK